MNYFLFVIIIALGCGGYFEYTTQQAQLNDDSATIETLRSDNKKLEDDKAQLTKSLADAEARAKGLLAASATAAAPAPALGNSLGTITTLDGKSFPNCQLIKIKPTVIVVNDSDGITEISYALMPPEMQKKFDYDPHQAAALTEAQIQFQEEQRAAAAAVHTTGN